MERIFKFMQMVNFFTTDKAAEKIRLPYDPKLSIYAQDDSFLTRPVWDCLGITTRDTINRVVLPD